MKWQKHGLTFTPENAGGWMKTHAQVPTPLICDGFIRIYFASRPEPNLSLTTFVDVDAATPARILRVNTTPVLELGKPGTFDEHGNMPASAVRDGARVLLYYSGWSRAVSVPYVNSTGLAISEDGGVTFSKISDGPVLARSVVDPYSATSPFVMKKSGAWHMWYCSGTGWLLLDGNYEHTYDIKYAHSRDGVCWQPRAGSVIAAQNEFEALTRPFLIERSNGYDMWFCYRGSYDFRDGEDAYRLGLARSQDLEHWHRHDGRIGLEPTEDGWDSAMMAYPAVVTANQETFLFYNGNGFGVEGFGYASLSED